MLETSAVVLKHAWDIYSPEVFEIFQKEFEDSCDLVIDQCNENGPLSEYKLSSFGKLCQHTVAFNSSDETNWIAKKKKGRINLKKQNSKFTIKSQTSTPTQKKKKKKK
ncbi:unnamed protein product, partial [Vitis vinifera]|uniref:Uncharacterized protein n=1 Tax=Vitis vinifera TaxID=29760 RepID=D7TSQ7_VITVI